MMASRECPGGESGLDENGVRLGLIERSHAAIVRADARVRGFVSREGAGFAGLGDSRWRQWREWLPGQEWRAPGAGFRRAARPSAGRTGGELGRISRAKSKLCSMCSNRPKRLPTRMTAITGRKSRKVVRCGRMRAAAITTAPSPQRMNGSSWTGSPVCSSAHSSTSVNRQLKPATVSRNGGGVAVSGAVLDAHAEGDRCWAATPSRFYRMRSRSRLRIP